MRNVLVNLEEQYCGWMIEKYFKNKSIVSIDELLDLIGYLDEEVESLKEEIEDLKSEKEEDNYDEVILREKGLV